MCQNMSLSLKRYLFIKNFSLLMEEHGLISCSYGFCMDLIKGIIKSAYEPLVAGNYSAVNTWLMRVRRPEIVHHAFLA